MPAGGGGGAGASEEGGTLGGSVRIGLSRGSGEDAGDGGEGNEDGAERDHFE